MPERTGPYPKFDAEVLRAAVIAAAPFDQDALIAMIDQTERALEVARKEVGYVSVMSGWAILPESGLGLVLAILCALTGKGPWEQ